VGDDVGAPLLITAMAVAAAASEVIDGRDIATLSPPSTSTISKKKKRHVDAIKLGLFQELPIIRGRLV
jgi:hypothetical protein